MNIQEMLKDPEENLTDYIIKNISYSKYFLCGESGVEFNMLKSYAALFEQTEEMLKKEGCKYLNVDNFDPENKEHIELFKEKFGDFDIIPNSNTSWESDEFPVTVRADRYRTKQGRNFYFIQLHAGGDTRNNWLKPYVIKTKDTDEEWFLYRLFDGFTTFDIHFKDGSEIYIDSRWGDTEIDETHIINSPGEDHFQLLLDGSEELIPRGEAHIMYKEYLKDMEPDELKKFIEECETWGAKRPVKLTEEEQLREDYENALNIELGIAYGWTMMPRGTMRRLFNPQVFNDEIVKIKERIKNE